jgi:hypothetical protein
MVGSAIASIALPTLDAMLNGNGTAYADGTVIPKRLGIFFWGNGMKIDRWTPTGTGTAWTPSSELMPLAPYQDYVSVVTGMQIKTGNPRGHHAGTVGILSGAPLIEQAHATDSFASTFSQPSIDVVAKRVIGTTTRRASLEVGVSRHVTTGEGTTLHYLSHNGPDNFNPPSYDPHAVFTMLFGTGSGFVPPGTMPPPVDPTLALRRSVLDAVTEDANALRGRVGTADKARIDQHLDGIRELERRLQTMPPPMLPPNACMMPGDPGSFPDMSGHEQLEPISRAMCDLVAMALACDQTRVFSIMFSGSVGSTIFWPVGATSEDHGMTHNEPDPQPIVHASVVYIMQRFAYLLDKLKNTPEGTGNLLDSCAILATSDVSDGKGHRIDEYPILVAGKAGGALRSGVHYRSTTGENTSKVLFSLLRAVGLPITTFGAGGGVTTSGLSAIEV